MSQDLYDLPAGWEWVTLDNVTVNTTNLSPEKKPETLWTYIDISAIDKDKFAIFEPKEILGKDAPSRAKKHIQQGDVLFATTRPNLKNIAIFELNVPNPVASTGFCILRPSEKIIGKFLFYFVTTDFVQKQIEPFISGASYPAVTDKNLKKVAIPLPPLAEQTRIVEKLDAVLSRIDTAIDELQQSLALVDAMFKSGLDKAFNPLGSPSNEDGLYDLPEGWGWKPLKSVCKFENGDRGKNYPSRDAFVDSGIAVINAGALNGKTVDESELNFITRERFDLLGSGKVKRGDLLFCLRGSLGKCAIVTNLDEGAIASSLVIVRPNELLSSEFLLNYFNSGLSDNFIKKYNNGAAQPNLSAANLGKFEIPLPSIYDQQTIVKALDSLNEHTTQLKTELTAKIGMFNQLKASVLDGAFRGLI